MLTAVSAGTEASPTAEATRGFLLLAGHSEAEAPGLRVSSHFLLCFLWGKCLFIKLKNKTKLTLLPGHWRSRVLGGSDQKPRTKEPEARRRRRQPIPAPGRRADSSSTSGFNHRASRPRPREQQLRSPGPRRSGFRRGLPNLQSSGNGRARTPGNRQRAGRGAAQAALAVSGERLTPSPLGPRRPKQIQRRWPGQGLW